MATAQHIALSKRIIDRLSVEGKDAVFPKSTTKT